ncbi:MAG: 50S ribosomal protein L6 [Mollicutes bacterium]|nr:50S ribosomal protein L6 [Mollicutes bacterium]
MSRIGNRKLIIPAGVTVTNENNQVTVKGPKGELKNSFDNRLEINVEENQITVKRPNDNQEMVSLHGTTNALLNNMLVGVHEGFKTELETIGVGYRFSVSGKKLVINSGYSHPVEMELPEGISAECPSNTEVIISGINKQEVNEFAANVRKVREPEPYKGKGIRYKGEYVRRKVGKKAA